MRLAARPFCSLCLSPSLSLFFSSLSRSVVCSPCSLARPRASRTLGSRLVSHKSQTLPSCRRSCTSRLSELSELSICPGDVVSSSRNWRCCIRRRRRRDSANDKDFTRLRERRALVSREFVRGAVREVDIQRVRTRWSGVKRESVAELYSRALLEQSAGFGFSVC